MASRISSRTRSILIGLVVLGVFGISVEVAINAAKGLPGQTRTVVYAAFDDVGALRSGDDVRIAGARVGQVGSIKLQSDHAVVQLKFDGHRTIYKNSTAVTASIGARSSLGQKYVAFTPGSASAGVIESGQVIPAAKTGGAQDLSDLVAIFDAGTRQALGSTIRQVGGGAAGHAQDVNDALKSMPTALTDLSTLSVALTDSNTDLTSMLKALDTLSGRFANNQGELANLVKNLDTTVSAVTVDQGKALDETIARAPGALTSVRAALGALQQPLAQAHTALVTLKSGTQALGAATPDIRGILREARSPLNNLPAFDQKASPALGDLTGVFQDLGPLAPHLTQALQAAQTPLQVLAPYSPEAAMWFTYATNGLSQGDADGHWLRFYVLANTESLTGILPLTDPLVARDAYPAPGVAPTERKTSLTGTGK